MGESSGQSCFYRTSACSLLGCRQSTKRERLAKAEQRGRRGRFTVPTADLSALGAINRPLHLSLRSFAYNYFLHTIVSGLEDGVVKSNYPIGTNLRQGAAWPRPRATARVAPTIQRIGLPGPCIVGVGLAPTLGWCGATCSVQGQQFTNPEYNEQTGSER